LKKLKQLKVWLHYSDKLVFTNYFVMGSYLDVVTLKGFEAVLAAQNIMMKSFLEVSTL